MIDVICILFHILVLYVDFCKMFSFKIIFIVFITLILLIIINRNTSYIIISKYLGLTRFHNRGRISRGRLNIFQDYLCNFSYIIYLVIWNRRPLSYCRWTKTRLTDFHVTKHSLLKKWHELKIISNSTILFEYEISSLIFASKLYQ